MDSMQLPSDWALRSVAARAAKFLHALAAPSELTEAMAAYGYTPEDHAEGVALLCSACQPTFLGERTNPGALSQLAQAELSSWVKHHFPRFHAALLRKHPPEAPLFAPLKREDPLVRLSAALETLEALSRKAPTHPMLQLLDKRGLGKTQQLNLRRKLDTAQGLTGGTASPVNTAAGPSAATIALAHWLSDWSTTARSAIRRKDWLILLGVQRRAARKKPRS